MAVTASSADGNETDSSADTDACVSITYTKAQRIFERAVSDAELCPLCFARKRRYYPDEAEHEARQLRWGATKGALRALGHDIREDGSLMVNTATSDPDPSTYYDVPPSTTIDGKYYPPRAQSICECGVVDYPEDETRTLSELHTCFDNIVKWYNRLELSSLPDEMDEDRGHDIITLLRQYDTLAGQDKIVLTEAIRRGLTQWA